VTASATLPAHCKCQHLTKFVFGLWLGGSAGWTQAQLLEFQLALLVEFLHRARVPLELKHTAVITPAQWADAHVVVPGGAELLLHATGGEAWKAWCGGLRAQLELVTPTDIIRDVAVTGEAFKARHFQFTYAAIAVVFRSLWALSGHRPYRFDVGTHALVSLLRTSAIADNAARIADPSFAAPVDDRELYAIAGTAPVRAFRAQALETARARFAAAYASASAAVHGGSHPPTLFLPDYVRRFDQAYRTDLRARYAPHASGLSAVACCIPTCPHYLVPLSRGRLRAHLDSVSVVPGLHKVTFLNFNWARACLTRDSAGRPDAAGHEHDARRSPRRRLRSVRRPLAHGQSR
jgi:hypothetical protein